MRQIYPTSKGQLYIGYLSENEAVQVVLPYNNLEETYGTGTLTLLHERPTDTSAYPCGNVTHDSQNIYWTVKSADVAKEGWGRLEVRYTFGTTGVAITERYTTCISKSLNPTNTTPSPWQSWVDGLLADNLATRTAANKVINMTAQATTLDAGASATASYNNGVLSIGVPKGADGQNGSDGSDGADGADGFSPTVTTSKTGKTTTITITDKNGNHTATVLDGNDGQNGRDGTNGRDGSDASVTATNIATALGYTPADAQGLANTDEHIAEDIEPDINQIKEDISNKLTKPSDAPSVGKILKVKTVNDDGTFVCEWGNAPSGGGGERYVVAITADADDETTGTSDRTFEEITEAIEQGKNVVAYIDTFEAYIPLSVCDSTEIGFFYTLLTKMGTDNVLMTISAFIEDDNSVYIEMQRIVI